MVESEFEANAGYLIAEVNRLMSRAYDRRMRALGLTRAQWWVLAQLHFNDGITQTALSSDLGFSKAALGGLLDRLESKGWIERRPHPEDGRANSVFATPKVRLLLSRMRQSALQMTRAHLSGLTAAQHAELVKLLQLLRSHLAADEDDARRPKSRKPRRRRAA